jgi:hypothetical protein
MQASSRPQPLSSPQHAKLKDMVLTLELPDEIALALAGAGQPNPARFALEALALEGYRDNRLTQKQVGEILGFSRIQTEDFLSAHSAPYDYDPAQLAGEAEALE